jgi:hypothetical protein
MYSGEYNKLILEAKIQNYVRQEFGPKFMGTTDVKGEIFEQKQFEKLKFTFKKQNKSLIFYYDIQKYQTIIIVQFFDRSLSKRIFRIRETEEIEDIITSLDITMKQFRLKNMYK